MLFKKRGFSLLEVTISILIFSLIVVTIQSTISNILTLKQYSKEDLKVYLEANNIYQYIKSGKGIPDYILTTSEKRSLKEKGVNFAKLKSFLPAMGRMAFTSGLMKVVHDEVIKIDDREYKVKLERKTIEGTPFLFGIKITVTDKFKHQAKLKGIISFYDYDDLF